MNNGTPHSHPLDSGKTGQPAGAGLFLQAGGDYILDLYHRFLQNEKSVPPEWADIFRDVDQSIDRDSSQASPTGGVDTDTTAAALDMKNGRRPDSLPSWVPQRQRQENKNGVIGVDGTRGVSLSDFLLKGVKKGETLDETINRYLADHGVLGQKEIEERLNSIRAIMLIRAFRTRGHLEADLDPLKLEKPIRFPELDYRSYGFSENDLEKTIYINYYLGLESAKLADIIAICRRAYCGRFAIEFMHIQDPDEKSWLQEMVESDFTTSRLSTEHRQLIYAQILHADSFETFLEKKYQGAKRFGLDGAESTIPVLFEIIKRGAQLGLEEISFGMAHRGRLNVLANILGKPYRQIFQEFYGGKSTPDNAPQMGDVKYHLGASHDITVNGRAVHLSLTPNPSHLEAVNTVVLGKVRAKQKQKNDEHKQRVMAVLLHGDAAFIGQGVVAETFLLSQLHGYRTGGTIHLAINNQIGFTTVPKDGRSSPYCTDMAKMIDAPVLHVNGDDPDVCARAAYLAVEYRQKFRKDIVIDIYCYRRHGHNEADEPFFTQPLMYEKIANHPRLKDIYKKKLIEEKILTADEMDKMEKDFFDKLESELALAKDFRSSRADWLEGRWSGLAVAEHGKRKGDTAIDEGVAQALANSLTTPPSNFNLHPKIGQQMERKREAVKNGKDIDWGMAEALAFGSLLLENTPIRLSGEDSQRGTFSHRHAVWIDQKDGREYVPLNNLRANQSKVEIINSPLSEFGLLGFEYGYSCAEPYALVLWEAQFGDFANGAQVIIDQFISSSETKWFKMCGLVLLLPHGYEGQGPEHSSARLERYLQLSADDNWQVCNPTTPANYFHVLRRQVKRNFRKPLVLMTPKSLLRHPLCISPLSHFVTGSSFRRILPDDAFTNGQLVPPDQFKRVIFCSGKIYFDIFQAREKLGIKDIVIVRLEQLYPFPDESLTAIIKKCLGAEFVWCQEEPENNGAWFFVRWRLEKILRELNAPHPTLRYIGRLESASPAVGSLTAHLKEQQLIIDTVLQ